MSKPKAQGTAWEREFVNRLQDAGLMADRLPEGGSHDRGDVWIGAPPDPAGFIYPPMVVVAWKRLTGSRQHRSPDGERDVVILSTSDFIELLQWASGNVDVVVECKATQTLNVTRTLAKAREKAAG